MKVLKKLNHPFHIEFIDYFDYQNQQMCIVTKLATGGELTKLINEKKKKQDFKEKEALLYLA